MHTCTEIPPNSEMSNDFFHEILKDRINKITEVLSIKAKEYTRNDDRMHNFNEGSRISGKTRESVLWGFALKHEISFHDMLRDIEAGNMPTAAYVDEKIGDLINYLILVEASIKHRVR